jgi:hypothetical protein
MSDLKRLTVIVGKKLRILCDGASVNTKYRKSTDKIVDGDLKHLSKRVGIRRPADIDRRSFVVAAIEVRWIPF